MTSAYLFKKHRGFSLLEVIVTLSVIVSLLSLGSRLLHQSFDRSVQQAVAQQQLQQISGASRAFVLDHLRQFTADEPALITIQQLKDEHYLPSFYEDNLSNLYQQSYHIQVFPDKAKGLLLLIFTTGGQSLPLTTLLTTSQRLGSQGGYIAPERITEEGDNVQIIG